MSNPSIERKVDRLQKWIGASNLVGIIIIFCYILNLSAIKQLEVDPAYFAHLALQGWSRMIVTTVLFCDVFLCMTITNWKKEGEQWIEDYGDHLDALFAAIEGTISKPNGGDIEGNAS